MSNRHLVLGAYAVPPMDRKAEPPSTAEGKGTRIIVQWKSLNVGTLRDTSERAAYLAVRDLADAENRMKPEQSGSQLRLRR